MIRERERGNMKKKAKVKLTRKRKLEKKCVYCRSIVSKFF